MKRPSDNMHQFNLTALAVFEKLYASFPTPIDFRPSHVGIDAAPPDASYEQAFNFGAEARHVVSWLEEEGFLRTGSIDKAGYYLQVRLTMRGLTILGSVPSALQAQEARTPIIGRVKKVLVAGTEKAGTEAAKALVSEIFRLSLQYGAPFAAAASMSV